MISHEVWFGIIKKLMGVFVVELNKGDEKIEKIKEGLTRLLS